MDIMFTGTSADINGSWANIIRVGTRDEGNTSHGDRTPIVSVNPSTTSLHIKSSINGDPNYDVGITDEIPIGQWTKLEIYQLYSSEHEQYAFTVRINEKIWKAVNNSDAREFNDVKVYAGDHHPPADVRIDNLVVQTYEDGYLCEYEGMISCSYPDQRSGTIQLHDYVNDYYQGRMRLFLDNIFFSFLAFQLMLIRANRVVY